MTCDHYIDMIGRKLEGSLSASETETLIRHMADCPACRLELMLQERISQALARVPSATLPGDFAEQVSRRAFDRARVEKRVRSWGYFVPVAANAVVVLLVVLYRADIAAALGPVFGGLGHAVASLFRGAGSGMVGVSAPVKAAGNSGTYLVGILGPLVGAFAAVIMASSRIYALRRR